MAYNLCRLFEADSIFYKWTVLFQTIQFSISIVFVYTQLNVKYSSTSNNSV